MSVTRTCAACGREFKADKQTRRYCSNKCSASTRSRPLIPRPCQHCGEIFAPKKTSAVGKFCSHSCHSESLRGVKKPEARTAIEKICQTCGNRYEVGKSREKISHYCSPACMYQGRKLVTGESHKLFKGGKVSVNCACCGKEIRRLPSAIRENNFCSRTCNGIYAVQKRQYRRSSLELLIEAELQRLGIEFKAQAHIGPFVMDFLLTETQTLIECDGDYWHSLPAMKERDIRKDLWAKENGYRMVRLSEKEIRTSPPDALRRGLHG